MRSFELAPKVVPGALFTYKWQARGANYQPESPWASVARFGDGSHKTLYLAATPEGAIAEFLRLHPELLAFQDDLQLVLFEIEVLVEGECLDLRAPEAALSVGVTVDELTSSAADPADRFAACWSLANDAVSAQITGLLYPSAAAAWATWNLVLFGDPGTGRWAAGQVRVVAQPPVLDPAQVRVLEPA